ncbi:restriction endonuclease subunit S [Latilactobacillus curvatus]|uniref:restriction endonuclease subunit S n=1 Tax=Latilactobacillus curvatus TaxID=28038 RepID=UPI00217E0F19|nr:restriction endonuclease subunit S [Latilactobacillus curvatus]MCS6143358.1 restriction endonuclease subunit S [Latilactobacillus curvatus]
MRTLLINWEQRELSDIAEVRTGKAFSSSDFTDDGEFRVVTNKNIQDKTTGKIFTGDRINVSDQTVIDKYVLSGENILVTMDGANIGKVGMYTDSGALLAQRVGRLNSAVLNFVYQIVSDEKFISRMNQLAVGNAIKHISLEQIGRYEIAVPESETEKTKIGQLLSNLDNLIAANQRKLDLLKEQKKGYLQKMFPKNGAKVPELRFAGFADDWEERKLGEFTTSFSGGTPSAGNSSYYKGDIPFIRSGEINSDKTELFLTEDGLKNSSAKMVSVGDILYALYGATSGEVGISQINGAINQAILAIKPIDGYSSYFIMQWLKLQKQKIIDKYLQGGQGNLSGSIVKNLILNVPNFEEQQKIGSFFKKLDDTIALQQSKVEKLKILKQSYLQKLFP